MPSKAGSSTAGGRAGVPPGRYRLDWPLLVLAAVIIVPFYWPTLGFDLYQDDYFLMRPWPPAHLVGVLTGPWFDPATNDYYRPLAVYFYKAMFYAFGLNTHALHALPMVLMSVLAWLIGRFVRRETSSLALGAAATCLYAIHPSPATAIGPWIANQYQGVVSAMVLLSLLWWQHCRERPWPYWLPLLVPITIGALTKETGLMIPLMIAAVQAARGRWLGDIRPSGFPVIACGLAVFVGLNLWRFAMLGTLGPPSEATVGTFVAQFVRGPYTVLFEPLNFTLPWAKYVFALAAFALTAAGVRALAPRIPHPSAVLALTGLVILCLAAVPTSVVFSRNRLTPHSVGAVLILTAGIAAIAPRLRRRWRVPALAAAVVAITASATITSDAIRRVDPCRSNTLDNPDTLLGEARQPPPEMLRWLRGLPRPCRTEAHVPFFRASPRITWGVARRTPTPGTVVHAWIRPRVVALLDQRGTDVRVQLRHPGASPDQPVAIRLSASGGAKADIVLTSAAWTSIRMPLAPTFRSWLRQMHRLEMNTMPNMAPGLEMRPLEVVY